MDPENKTEKLKEIRCHFMVGEKGGLTAALPKYYWIVFTHGELQHYLLYQEHILLAC